MKYVAFNIEGVGATSRDSMTVHEPEPATPIKTGLLNRQGVPLYRLPEPKVCGFFDLRKDK